MIDRWTKLDHDDLFEFRCFLDHHLAMRETDAHLGFFLQLMHDGKDAGNPLPQSRYTVIFGLCTVCEICILIGI